MRRPSKDTPPRSISASKSRANLVTKHLYFCHYRNGMYMGQVQNFQKHGLGMVIHDNGASVLSSYYQDMLDDYNLVIYKDGSVASIRYHKDKMLQVLYKGSKSMMFAKYAKGYPDGGAILLKTEDEEIVYVNYKMGQIICRSEEGDAITLNRVFMQKNYTGLFPKKHLMNLDLNGKYHDQISISRRAGKIVVGFSKDKLLLNGLSITLLCKGGNICTSHCQVMQRGYYKNSQLSGFGHRNFKNGNYYSGQFKYDQFQGTGVLRDVNKKSWVCGNFERGTLVELMTYGNDRDEKQVSKTLECIHEGKTTWVDKQLLLPHQNFFEKQTIIIERFKDSQASRAIDHRKIEVLRKIQQNFMQDGDEEYQEEEPDSRRFQIYKESILPKEKRQAQRRDLSAHKRDSSLPPNAAPSQSKRRNRIFQSNTKPNPESTQKSSIFKVHPVPIQSAKEIQSRLQFKQPPVRFFTPPPKTLPRQAKTTNTTNLSKPSARSSKSPAERSPSISKIHKTLNLIDSMYKKKTNKF